MCYMTPCLSIEAILPWNSRPHRKQTASPLRRITVQGNNSFSIWTTKNSQVHSVAKMYSNVTVGHTVFGTNLRPWPLTDALYVNMNSGILSLISMNKSCLGSQWHVRHDWLTFHPHPLQSRWLAMRHLMDSCPRYYTVPFPRVVSNCTAHRPTLGATKRPNGVK
jgi:hypothetical protein